MRATSIIITSIAAVATLLLAGGCEDAEARQRAEVQLAIADASSALNDALVTAATPGDPAFEDVRGKLRSVASTAGGLTGGADGQQAAAALIAATANRELAQLALAGAGALESEARAQREVLHSRVSASVRLDTLASGREMLGSDEERALLSDGRSRSREMLGEYRQRVEDLSGPIEQYEAENERDGAEAARLGDEANARYREASERGHADGLASFEEAIQLEREADKYQFRRAHREIDLRYDLAPEQDLAQSSVAFHESLLTTIDATESALDQYDSLGAEQVTATRRVIGKLDDEIGQALAELRETTTAQAAFYDQASERLQQSISQAQRSASKSGRADAGAARVAAARGHELHGRLHWARARSLADEAALVGRLAQSASFLDSARGADRVLSEVTEAHGAAVEEARAAYDSALSELAQAGGGGQEVESFRRSLELSISALSGEAPPAASVAAAGPGAMTPSRPSRPGGGGGGGNYRHNPTGAESPEALVDALLAVEDMSGATAIFDVTAPLEGLPAAQRQAVLRLMSFADAMAQLDAALKEQFGRGMDSGEGMDPIGDSMSLDSSIPASATVQNVSGSTGTIVAEMRDGSTQTLAIEQIGDRWFLSADHMTEDMPDLSDPESAAMMEGMLGMFDQMAGMLRTFANDVRSGQYASFEDFSGAMQELGGMMGGG
jgi:hypothetical protein